jgi:hypothetical protein
LCETAIFRIEHIAVSQCIEAKHSSPEPKIRLTLTFVGDFAWFDDQSIMFTSSRRHATKRKKGMDADGDGTPGADRTARPAFETWRIPATFLATTPNPRAIRFAVGDTVR